ncbi:MAG: shikimate dehydrogenase [Anaerotardibacter sp.]
MKKQDISGATKYIALVGSPVKNSLSPTIHNASFEKLGLDYVYVAFDSKENYLLDSMRGMASLGFLGFNVTTPCKTAIMPYLDEVSTVAEIMGAVNTVVIQKGRFLGDNADGAAFMRSLVFKGVNIRGKKITVLGGGGAGSAIITQAALDGVSAIDIYNRKDAHLYSVSEVVSRLQEYAPDCAISIHPLDDEEALVQSLSESALVVNATTVGTYEVPGCLLKKEMLRKDLIVADAVYTPRDTELLKLAKECGCVTVDGVGMFLQQAAIGERLWVGCSMPVDEIEAELF